MLSRGTDSHSKASFNEEVEGMGARLNTSVEREKSSISMQCMKGDLGRAINLLGDAVSNANLDPSEIELTKQEVAQEHEKNHTDYERMTMEQCHFNAYRDHMLGQPTNGDPDQL